MKYGLSFAISSGDKNLNTDVYAMNFINDMATRFQIFANTRLEGFMLCTDKWTVDKYSFGTGIL